MKKENHKDINFEVILKKVYSALNYMGFAADIAYLQLLILHICNLRSWINVTSNYETRN